MKNKVFKYISFFLALFLIFSACEKTDIQKANDAYDFDKIVPVVQGITGPSDRVQTFTGNYSPSYFRGGSSWSWSVSNASINSTSGDTRDIELLFTNEGEVELTVIETTQGGLTSEPYSITISVASFCPLDDLNDLVGTYSGTDNNDYPTHVVTSLDGANFMIIGLNQEWMVDYWGETIEEMVPVVVTVNPDGTLEIAKQYYMTTLWNGEPYRYEISATGMWDNCLKTLYIDYKMWYEGDAEDMGYEFIEDITLVP